jgi:hypothetical protein
VDLKTSQFPRQPSTQREQSPLMGTTLLERLKVPVASFALGVLKLMCDYSLCRKANILDKRIRICRYLFSAAKRLCLSAEKKTPQQTSDF